MKKFVVEVNNEVVLVTDDIKHAIEMATMLRDEEPEDVNVVINFI